jgi:hypothetical protein
MIPGLPLETSTVLGTNVRLSLLCCQPFAGPYLVLPALNL